MKNNYKWTLSSFNGKKFFKKMYAAIVTLSIGMLSNAQVSTYSFTQSSGTYVTSSATATILETATGESGAASLDNIIYPISLPFGFNFNGVVYNSLNLSTNGFVTFGATAPATNTYTPISIATAYEGAISAWGNNINAVFSGAVAGKVSWEVVGVAPNRTVVFEWKDFKPEQSTITTSVYSFSFQIRLHETTNVIQTVYNSGSYIVGSTVIDDTAQIGLRGMSNADFNNRLNSTTVNFVNSTSGTSNASSQAFDSVNSTPGMPTAGLTYTWTPPTCYPPTGVTVNNITSSSAMINWTTSSSMPGSGYDIYYSTSNVDPISTTTPTNPNVSGTSFSLGSLAPYTQYYVWVRSSCSGSDKSVWSLVSPFITDCNAPSLLSTNGATVCANSAATLSATAQAGANVVWYGDATGGSVLGTGNTFTTPPLATTTNYYASASTGTGFNTVGKLEYSPNPSSGSGTTNFGLLFDVLAPCTLKEVTIYPVTSSGISSGTVTIDVINSNGVVVHTKTVTVTASPSTAPVAQVVNLDFSLLPGTNYKLRPGARSSSIAGLLFDPSANAPSGNYGYPFTAPGLLTITSSTLTAAPTNTNRPDLYYYFYNLKVGSGCESPRQQVTATVDAAGCLSTSEVATKDAFKIHPNPFTDVVNITNIDKVKSISVFDATGRLVKSNIKVSENINLSDLKSGMYLLSLELKDGSKVSHKIMKK